mmetsp:Transcript_47518/g.151647  ORF Transcript_47518/g.151647 Transcript_47518/m.151647 type:complete len:207 (-) Transcript_47518:8-628(-)
MHAHARHVRCSPDGQLLLPMGRAGCGWWLPGRHDGRLLLRSPLAVGCRLASLAAGAAGTAAAGHVCGTHDRTLLQVLHHGLDRSLHLGLEVALGVLTLGARALALLPSRAAALHVGRHGPWAVGLALSSSSTLLAALAPHGAHRAPHGGHLLPHLGRHLVPHLWVLRPPHLGHRPPHRGLPAPLRAPHRQRPFARGGAAIWARAMT